MFGMQEGWVLTKTVNGNIQYACLGDCQQRIAEVELQPDIFKATLFDAKAAKRIQKLLQTDEPKRMRISRQIVMDDASPIIQVNSAHGLQGAISCNR